MEHRNNIAYDSPWLTNELYAVTESIHLNTKFRPSVGDYFVNYL